MGDPTHLEKMGRELKCPICLSLLNSAVSLTCNHIFCNSCIAKSMKSSSNCPVCKVPYQRREVRPASHMDNLVSIYKSMEAASGFQIFVTQNPPSTKLFDQEKQAEDDTNVCQNNRVENQRMSKRNGPRKKVKSNPKVSDSVAAKPSFPTKKRVQVPQCLPSDTPTRPDKSLIKPDITIKDGFKDSSLVPKENLAPNGKGEPVLSPFFWLRDQDDMEKSSQRTVGSQLFEITPPHVPTFSEIKDSDDECPSRLSPAEEVRGKSNDADFFDSEMFEWTQRACSPELYSTPYSPEKMQDDIASGIHGTQQDRQQPSSLSSNSNGHSIENEKCKSEDRMVIAEDESPTMLNLRPQSTNTQVVSNKSNRKGSTARKSVLKKCAKKDAEQNLKNSSSKPKSNRTLQREACENNGFNITNESREKVDYGATVTEFKPENVLPVSLKGGSLNLSDNKMEADLPPSSGERQCDKNLRKRDTGKMCQKATTVCQNDHPLRLKKQKLDFATDAIEGNTTQNPKDEDISPSKVGGMNISDIKWKHQIFRKEFNSALSSESNKKLRHKIMKVSFHNFSEVGSLNDHQEGHRNIPAEETELIEKVTDVFLKENQSIEKVRGNPGSSILHNSVMSGKLDQEKGVDLQSCQSHKIICAFCLSSEDSEASGEMLHFFNGKPVAASYAGGSKVIHSHRNCAEWAPNVFFDDDNAINLEAELTRSKKIKCSCCGLKGAALGCYEKSCRKSFHVTCAKLTPQCRWDTYYFVMLCPLHASSKLPNENLGAQDRSRKCASKRQKSNQSNQVSKPDASICPSWNANATQCKLVLCCSALTAEEREFVSEFQRLSGATVLKNWDLSVTHVIASMDENGACRRTLKILMGILEGKWILSIEWVKACIKALKPVQEDPFEILVDVHRTRDGPRFGRLRILNKQPKIFEGLKFYLMGDFVASYKGYIQDLIVAGGGTVLHRKPLSGDQGASSPSAFIIYSIELPDKCDPNKKDMILNRRRVDAEALASASGAKAVNNSWVLNSIAACRLQNH